MKTIIIALATIALAHSAFAGFAIVNGHQVYFGQSGHWATQYDDDGETENIWRNDGDSWRFPQNQDQDEDDNE